MVKITTCFFLAGAVAFTHSTAVASGADDVMDLSLEQLLAVQVVGASKYKQKQSEVAAAVSVITRNDIKTFGWRTLDEALASLPGVYATYDRQYNYLGTRGFSVPGDLNTRVLVLINGNRVNDPIYDNGTFGPKLPLDIDLIERIEFIPGPGGAVYGQNAMFGVVNVITRTGATVDGTELAAASQNPQATRDGRATWGKLFDNGLDVLLSASVSQSSGEDLFYEFPGTPISSGIATGLDGSRGRSFFGRIARNQWSVEHVYGSFRKDDPTGVYFSDPLMPGQFQEDSYSLTQLQYQDKVTDKLQVLGRLFMGQYSYQSDLRYDTVFSFPANSNWYGGELRVLSNAMANHRLMVGLEAQHNQLIEQNIVDVSAPANNIVISSSGYRVGLFAQDEWQISDTVTSTLGLRLDRNDINGNKFSPRAALIWQATPATVVKALYGRAHRAPNAYERDYYDGLAQVASPSLRGESINTAELVVDQAVGQDLALRGSLYQWTMHGIVTLGDDPVSGLTQFQNGKAVNARGVELSANKSWDSGARLRGSVTYQNTFFETGADLPNSPELMTKLNFSAPLASTGLQLGYELQYYSERKTIDGTTLASYWLSNLNLRAPKWVKGLDLSLALYNLFDERYQQPGADNNWQPAFTQDGRSVRIKAEYRF